MEFNLIQVIAIVFIVIAIYMLINNRDKNIKQNKSLVDANHLSSEYGIIHYILEYLGGHPRMSGVGNVKITASKDFLTWTGNKPILIPLDTIKSIEMKTESQISKDVTLTRLLTTGIFALAWKKKTTIENIYLIFNFEEYNVPYTAIFRADNKYKQAQSPITSIINITNRNLIELNRLKIEKELVM